MSGLARRVISIVGAFFILASSVAMIAMGVSYMPGGQGAHFDDSQRLTTWRVTATTPEGEPVALGDDGEEAITVELPTNLAGGRFSPGDIVTLSARMTCSAQDRICLASTYAQVQVRANGTLVGGYGAPGTYPAFMSNPAPAVNMYPLATEDGPVDVEISYVVPAKYWGLRLSPVLVGTHDSLRAVLFVEMGWILFLSVIVAAMGVALVLASLVGRNLGRTTLIFRWLGLFSICIGVWIFGETDLTGLILRRPVLLHVMTYVAFYTSTIPYLRLKRSIMGAGLTMGMDVVSSIAVVFAAVALSLQALGVWQFSQSLFAYYGVCTLAYGYVTIKMLHDIFAKNEKTSRFERVFLISSLSFDVFLVLEIANYYVLHVMPDMGFYMLGAILFMVLNVLVASVYMRDAAHDRERAREAQARLQIVENRVDSERRRYDTFAESRRELRRQRHDMRHQFAAMRGYLDAGDLEGLSRFVDSLDSRIPEGDKQRYCDEFAVDAVCGYYVQQAHEAGIEDIRVHLGVPEKLEHMQEDDLCAIVGNMLENAIGAAAEVAEASDDAAGGVKPFVHLSGGMRADLLTITMDNSYRAVSMRDDGSFATTKENGNGIGLGSIEACAARNQGGARFEAREDERVFRSSVCLRIKNVMEG